MKRFLDFMEKAFSDNGSPSSSRILGALSVITVLIGWLYVCIHSAVVPDATASAGAAALGTAPYAVNRATTAWGKDKPAPTEEKPNGT